MANRKFIVEIQRSVVEQYEVEAEDVDAARLVGEDITASHDREYIADSYTEYDVHVVSVALVVPDDNIGDGWHAVEMLDG